MELLEVCFARIKQEGAWLRIYDCRRGVTDRLAVIDSLDITIVQVDDIPGQGTQSVDAQMIQDARVLLSKPGLENLVIISSDSDFNHPIEYISRQGVKVYRIGRLSMKVRAITFTEVRAST